MKEFIRSLMEELLGVTTKWVYQEGPKPKKPFATLLLSSIGSRGMDEKRKADGQVEVIGRREAVLEVEYFGADAVTALTQLDQKMLSDTISDRCFKEGIIFFDSGEVMDITELLDTSKYEERAMLEFRIRFSRSTVDQTGYFENVEIQDGL